MSAWPVAFHAEGSAHEREYPDQGIEGQSQDLMRTVAETATPNGGELRPAAEATWKD